MKSIPAGLCLVLVPAVLWPQVQEDEGKTRSLWDTTFLNKRPPAKKPAASPAGTAAAPRPATQDEAAFIGLTLWRLRQSRPEDQKGVRMLVHGAGDSQEWTPERVGADALTWGQKVRFSIETDREGYLYVIDRERFADGALGDPSLIFPTQSLRGGNNHVITGNLVEIPAWNDDPSYLKLQRNRPDHVGEALTILVMPQPLSGLEIAKDAIPLPADLVASWEKRWGVPFKPLQAHSLAGRPVTTAEIQAGTQKGSLTQADPPPQTLYRLVPKAGDPLLITIPVTIR